MLAFLRLIIYGVVALSIVYFAVSIYSRSVRREKLEKRWAEDHPGDDDSPEREAYVEAGMAEYNKGIRPKLILLVYVIPTIVIGGILILTNVM